MSLTSRFRMIFFGFALCYCWFRKNVEPQYGSDLYLRKIYMISDDPGSHLYLYLGVNVFVKTDFYIRQCKNKFGKNLQILLCSTFKSTFFFFTYNIEVYQFENVPSHLSHQVQLLTLPPKNNKKKYIVHQKFSKSGMG